jgi:predicted amidophosphoribosyltransferase
VKKQQKPPSKGKQEIVLCHCCEKPATNSDGSLKTAPICWECIRQAGSVERKCADHEKHFDKNRKKGIKKT